MYEDRIEAEVAQGADMTWTDHDNGMGFDGEEEQEREGRGARQHGDTERPAAGNGGGAGNEAGSNEANESANDGVIQVGGTEYAACSSKREVGCLAVWSVTSNKPGNGVEYLRDNNVETYWQSDGTQPHLVNIQFQRKVRVLEVVLYVDYRNDESYTPQKISFRVGNSYYDLQEVKTVELEEPQGWVVIPLAHSAACGANQDQNAKDPDTGAAAQGFVRTHCLQIAVLSNHQNGRDTHLRQVKVFGPRIDVTRSADQPFSFANPEFFGFSQVR